MDSSRLRWQPAPGRASSQSSRRSCIELGAWDSSHFSADQDWVPIANGQRPQPDTLWRWASRGGETGYLLNQGSGGHLNSRPGGFVRGHGNEERPPRRPAGALPSAELDRRAILLSRYAGATETRDCAWPRITYYTLRFRKLGAFLHVEEDGGLAAHKGDCSDDLSCVFVMEPASSGWLAVRSVLTGALLRMVGDAHPKFEGWEGVRAPKARKKSSARLEAERRASDLAQGPAARCPLTPRGEATRRRDWNYNASWYTSLIRRSLAPWYDGGVSATAVDMAFWREMYPYQNRFERPSLHVSVSRAAGLRSKWQPAAPRPGESVVHSVTSSAPPAGSSDDTYLRQLRNVSLLVELPEVEWVAHTATLPKVPAQNLELVLGPSTDPAHNDVPMPPPWLHTQPAASPGGVATCATAHGSRRPQLLLQALCVGSPDGFRGPLWQFYPQHRAALLAARDARLRERLVVGSFRPCTGPRLQGLPLEAAWDAKAASELLNAVSAQVLPQKVDPCAYRWELLLDGQGPPMGLEAAMARGATVLRQASPYVTVFSSLLVEWEHFVPVADNLGDLAARVGWVEAHPVEAAHIAAAAQLLTSRWHMHEIACFWWQLLTALAPLEDFEPRVDSTLGFVALT